MSCTALAENEITRSDSTKNGLGKKEHTEPIIDSIQYAELLRSSNRYNKSAELIINHSIDYYFSEASITKDESWRNVRELLYPQRIQRFLRHDGDKASIRGLWGESTRGRISRQLITLF